MKLIKVAAGVLNQTPLAWDANQANIAAAIRQARQQDVTVLCLPEMCITGYGCEDAFHAPGTERTAKEVLRDLLPETDGIIVSLGLPIMHSGGLFNTACLIADGHICGLAAKQNLAGEGIHYEPRWFKPWPANTRVDVSIGDSRYPMGDLLFDCDGILIGFEICEDAWVAERPGSELAQHGVDVILNPSASHFAFGKHAVRQRFVLEGSRAFHVSYVYTNLLGNEAGRAIYDGDAMIASSGQLHATAPRFSFADFHLTTAVVDIDQTRMQRARTGSFQPDVRNASKHIVSVPFHFPNIPFQQDRIEIPAWEHEANVKEEEFSRAVALGLFDYLRKSRSRGFVVSLSGGADSAAVASLAAMLVRLAVSEIGRDAFLAKLDYLPQLADQSNNSGMVQQLLTCVYQSTQHSSDVTRNAAHGVAKSIGARYLELNVEPIVQQYVTLVSKAVGRELTWQQDDIALQNIQARVRSPSVWMLANLQGALLLSTSNRSEAAVGYATMDGDTSGGLSPIAGIDKAYLRHLLRWLEQQGPTGIGPNAAIQAVNVQQPTAELRPQASGQTDEDDLMPYDVLDTIERAAIRDKLVPIEVFQRLQVTLAERYTASQLGGWVDRFFRLWARNQWKRERYAPSFHLDDENLDPKTWCRFPILSGGFRRELRQLAKLLDGLTNTD